MRDLVNILCGVILLFGGAVAVGLVFGASFAQALRAAAFVLTLLTAITVALSGAYLVVRVFDR